MTREGSDWGVDAAGLVSGAWAPLGTTCRSLSWRTAVRVLWGCRAAKREAVPAAGRLCPWEARGRGGNQRGNSVPSAEPEVGVWRRQGGRLLAGEEAGPRPTDQVHWASVKAGG